MARNVPVIISRYDQKTKTVSAVSTWSIRHSYGTGTAGRICCSRASPGTSRIATLNRWRSGTASRSIPIIAIPWRWRAAMNGPCCSPNPYRNPPTIRPCCLAVWWTWTLGRLHHHLNHRNPYPILGLRRLGGRRRRRRIRVRTRGLAVCLDLGAFSGRWPSRNRGGKGEWWYFLIIIICCYYNNDTFINI